MKQFDEWHTPEIENKLIYLDPEEIAIISFRAGMLAAADIADNYAFYIQSKDSGEYAIGNNIGVKIREAANGNTNNS